MNTAHSGNRPGPLSVLQVLVQFAGIGLSLWPWSPADRGNALLLLPCLAGVTLGVWTLAHNRLGNFSVFPEPKRDARLVTSGPYALVRHPMYGALILVVASIAAWHGHLLNGLGVVLVVVAVAGKARREEKFLRQRFAGYDAYRARSRWFVPYLW